MKSKIKSKIHGYVFALLILLILFSIFLFGCGEKGIEKVEKEKFCGISSFGKCVSDEDCVREGCSKEICQSKKEKPLSSICIWKECFNAEKYRMECGCINKSCQWVKKKK